MELHRQVLSEDELFSFSQFALNLLRSNLSKKKHLIVLMTGDMGAGKTTFIRKLLSLVSKNQFVNSPTYTVENLYETELGEIHHFDFYRLKTLEEIRDLGLEEIWENPGISFIEWWEKGKEFLLNNFDLEIEIQNLSETSEKRRYILRSGITQK